MKIKLSRRPGVTPYLALAVALATLIPASTKGELITLDFEDLTDLDLVGISYAIKGVVFFNAIALQSGFSLNELDFPPHSGSIVISDYGAPILGEFALPVFSLSAYITYATPVTLSAYDANDNLLGSITSATAANYVSAPGVPNEFIQFSHDAGIRSFRIAGDPAGGSIVLDDFAFGSVVPETSTVCAGVVVMLLALRAACLRRSADRAT